MAKRSVAALGAGFVILSSLFYGSYGVWTRLMGDDFGSFAQAALRSLIVVAILLPIVLLSRQWSAINWRRDKWWLLTMFLTSFLISGPVYYATLQIGVGLAAAILYMGIVLSLFVFGWLLNNEKFTKDKLLATMLGLVGLWLVFSPSVESFGVLPLLAAFVSGAAVGLNIICCKKLPYSASQATLLSWGIGVAANAMVAVVLAERVPQLSWDPQWLYLFCYALAGLLSFWLVIKGVRLIDAGIAGILGLLEIVFGVVFGVLLFHEQPGPVVLLGMGLIIAAAAVPSLMQKSKPAA